MRNPFRRKTAPVDAFMHTHSGRAEHIHSHASFLHKHAISANCHEPECKTFPKHNVHNGPNVKLDSQ